jgi:hypothetical protein
MWLTNDSVNSNVLSFDVYIQRTGATPLSVYSFQLGFTYTVAALNGGTFIVNSTQPTWQYVTGKSGWSNVDTQIVSVETPKGIGLTPQPYIKCGFNVNSGGSGAGILIVSQPDSMKIGRITLTSTVPLTGLPLITWYMGGGAAGGLLTKIQATNGTTGFDVTANGTFEYHNPHGIILPVELTSFRSVVNGRQINLNWETKTELNTRQFEIERALVSTKDVTTIWASVGSVNASGTTTTPKQYSYTEKNLQTGKYQYRIKMIDNDGSFKYSPVVETEVAVPKDFAVSQNYPNPFNPTTKIDYQVPVDAKVILEVYSITGQKVVELVNQDKQAGYYSVQFGTSSKLASGVYIYRILAIDKVTGNNFSSIKKMMLLK